MKYLYKGQMITASSKEEAIKIITVKQPKLERVVARDEEHLKKLIEETIEKYGNECDLNFIDVSKVKDMSDMFWKSDFNGDISKWDVSNVENMSFMFSYSKFNKDISKWDVSKVKYMYGMFKNSKFNGDISNWNVGNVTDMKSMFWNSDFNGDISKWSPKMKKNGIKFEELEYPVKEDTFKDLEI